MAIKFDTLDKNIASAATNVNGEEVIYVTKQELNDILYELKQEIIYEIIEPIKKDIDKIAKNTNNLSKNIKELNDDVNNLKTKVDKIYEPIIAERRAAAMARINSGYYNKLLEEANNKLDEEELENAKTFEERKKALGF